MRVKAVTEFKGFYDTVVCVIGAENEITFSQPLLERAFKAMYEGDSLKIAHGKIKTLRLKVAELYCDLVLLGFDSHEKNPHDAFRKAIAELGTVLVGLESERIFVDGLSNITFTNHDEVTQQFVSQLPLCQYAFDRHLTNKVEQKEMQVNIATACQDAIDEACIIADSVMITRDLVNEIAEIMTPEKLANECETLGKKCGFDVEVLDRSRCETLGMGLFLAVAKGSVLEPKLIIMRYHGAEDEAPIGIIGKGVTYDSGGLSIKKSGMDLMRYDMNGAAAAIGAMCAISGNKLKINVVVVIAACENMVDALSFRNGDILTSMNGKTVYVDNTDAEGRLTMADALTYCIRMEKPASVIEIAGLTGSVGNFLGPVCAAALTEDDVMYNRLIKTCALSGEKYMRLPTFDEYQNMLKAPNADLRNSSATAGGITAGMFLQEFSEDTPFMHIDLGYTPFTRKASDGQPEGATGFGVKSLYYYIKSM